jgi:hypothetical protein
MASTAANNITFFNSTSSFEVYLYKSAFFHLYPTMSTLLSLLFTIFLKLLNNAGASPGSGCASLHLWGVGRELTRLRLLVKPCMRDDLGWYLL